MKSCVTCDSYSTCNILDNLVSNKNEGTKDLIAKSFHCAYHEDKEYDFHALLDLLLKFKDPNLVGYRTEASLEVNIKLENGVFRDKYGDDFVLTEEDFNHKWKLKEPS